MTYFFECIFFKYFRSLGWVDFDITLLGGYIKRLAKDDSALVEFRWCGLGLSYD